MMLSEIVGFIAGAIGISSALPQTLRIRKLGHSKGVSLPTWLIGYSAGSSWVGYGITTNSPAQWVTNGISCLLTMTVIFAILKNHPRTYFILVVIPFIFITFALLVPHTILSGFLLIFSATKIPQVVKSWRTWRVLGLSAVSIPACLFSMIDDSFWITYGVLGHRVVVEVTATLGIVLTGIIVFMELNSRYRKRTLGYSI